MIKVNFEKILDDWPAKMLSLAGAIALFFFYQFNKLEERPLSVPLTVISNDKFVPASSYPRTVRLVLRGEANGIYAVLEGDIVATLDLREFNSAGTWRVPVRIEKKGSAIGIEPLEISVDPSDVAISLEARLVKEIPVVPSFRGFLDPGYELAGFKLAPARIEASGPASLMENITNAATETIELTGRSENFTVTTQVALKDPLVKVLSSNSIEFSAEIKKTLVHRSFHDLEIRLIGLQEGLIAENSALGMASLAGSSIELGSFIPSTDALTADLSEIHSPGNYAIAVSPNFPPEFEVESWAPMLVYINIVKNEESDANQKKDGRP